VQPGQSIQAAIDSASPGDVIEVQSGLYIENLMIDKAITLIGEGTCDAPIIDAWGTGSAMALNADGIHIEGFEIRNSSKSKGSGMNVLSSDNIILGNNVSHNIVGIEINYSSGNTVENNTATDNGFGIYLTSSSANTIRGNRIYGNDFGLYLKSSSGNTIQGNTISDSYYRDLSDDASNLYNSNSIDELPYGSYQAQGAVTLPGAVQAEAGAISPGYATSTDAGTYSRIYSSTYYRDAYSSGGSYPHYQPGADYEALQPSEAPSETTVVSSQQGINIIDHSMARGILPSGEASGRTSAFSAQDAYAYSWVKFGPVYEEHSIGWKWYSPDGSLYTTSEGGIPDPRSQGLDHWYSPKYWSKLTISGDPAQGMPGLWRVEFCLDGRPMLSEQFTIG